MSHTPAQALSLLHALLEKCSTVPVPDSELTAAVLGEVDHFVCAAGDTAVAAIRLAVHNMPLRLRQALIQATLARGEVVVRTGVALQRACVEWALLAALARDELCDYMMSEAHCSATAALVVCAALAGDEAPLQFLAGCAAAVREGSISLSQFCATAFDMLVAAVQWNVYPQSRNLVAAAFSAINACDHSVASQRLFILIQFMVARCPFQEAQGESLLPAPVNADVEPHLHAVFEFVDAVRGFSAPMSRLVSSATALAVAELGKLDSGDNAERLHTLVTAWHLLGASSALVSILRDVLRCESSSVVRARCVTIYAAICASGEADNPAVTQAAHELATLARLDKLATVREAAFAALAGRCRHALPAAFFDELLLLKLRDAAPRVRAAASATDAATRRVVLDDDL